MLLGEKKSVSQNMPLILYHDPSDGRTPMCTRATLIGLSGLFERMGERKRERILEREWSRIWIEEGGVSMIKIHIWMDETSNNQCQFFKVI